MLAACMLLPSSTAGASSYSQVLHTYQLRGSIPPCKFSSAQLSAALKGVDTYGEQYFADFTDALQSALAARASGACTPGPRTPAQPAPSARATSLRVGSVPAPSGADLPAPIVLMAALAAVLGIAAMVGATARVRGWDPAWAASWRHAWAEAGYRFGGLWAEVRDWLRSGS